MAGSARVGSGHRAGGADLASGVDTAGTVARMQSICVCCTIPAVRSLLLTPVRPLGSFSGDSRPSGPRGYVPVARHRLPELRRPQYFLIK